MVMTSVVAVAPVHAVHAVCAKRAKRAERAIRPIPAVASPPRAANPPTVVHIALDARRGAALHAARQTRKLEGLKTRRRLDPKKTTQAQRSTTSRHVIRQRRRNSSATFTISRGSFVIRLSKAM